MLVKKKISYRVITSGLMNFFFLFAMPCFAISVNVQAPQCKNLNQIKSLLTKFHVPGNLGYGCCDQVVGLGLRDKTNKNHGGMGRSYSKSGLKPGVNYGFGFGQGHFWDYTKVGCGRFVLHRDASILLLCKSNSDDKSPKKTLCRSFMKYD